MEWSDEWDYEGMTFIRCIDCKKAMPLKFKENHKCKGTEEKQKEVGEFKKGTDMLNTVQQDVDLLNTIRQLLEDKLGRELEGEEHAWVSTIYIQRTKKM